MAPSPVPGDRLSEQLQALRALARQLVRDTHAAEDAVQDTLLVAMTRPAPGGVHLRTWLAAILRNTVRQRGRADRRRARREVACSPAEPAPSAAEAAAELAQHRRLLQLVQELEEPARHTLFLRFWRGLAPRAIAESLGVPTKTVHSRLQRGLARLRTRLDDEGGGRAHWLPGLAAFAAARAPAAGVVPATSLLMLMKTKLLVGLSVVAAVLVLLPWIAPGAGHGSIPPVPAEPVAPWTAAGPAAAPARGAATARTAVAVGSPAAAAAPPVVAAPSVQGWVFQIDGQPAAGVGVAFWRLRDDQSLDRDATIEPVVSDADGRFALPLPAHRGCLDVTDDQWSSVLRPALLGQVPNEPPVIVVGPARRYAGVVVDPAGLPVPGARVVVGIDGRTVPTRAVRDQVLALPDDLAATETDELGRFAFARVAYLAGARLEAECEPWGGAVLALPETSSPALVVRLGAVDPAVARVHGIVLGPGGDAVAGAWVAVGGDAVRAAADGRFAAPWPPRGRPNVVHAVHPDHGATQVRWDAATSRLGRHPDLPITLVLPAAPGACTGRVLHADGQPAAGVSVWTPDLTYLGHVVGEAQGRQLSGGATVEGVAAGGGTPLRSLTVDTDAAGRFSLRGLLDRDYALFAIDPRTLAAVGPVQVVAGEDVELRLPAVVGRRVAGRAVANDGDPLVGVRVSLGRALAWEPAVREPDSWANSPTRPPGAGRLFDDRYVTTDAQGRFAFDALALEGSYMWFHGDPVFRPPPFRLSADTDTERLEVVLPARCTFVLTLRQPGEATRFVLERQGRFATVFMRVEGFVMSMGHIDLVEGRSPRAYTAAGPATVVLSRGEVEVRRVEVVLPPGRGHEIEL